MASLNRVILMGNVGNEPSIKNTASSKIASISLCTTVKGYTKQDGTKVEDKSEWHRVTIFGKRAEVIEKYVHKGSSLYVEGHLHYDSYEKDGNKIPTTDIIVDDFQFLGSKTDGGNKNNGNTQTSTATSNNNSDNDSLPF